MLKSDIVLPRGTGESRPDIDSPMARLMPATPQAMQRHLGSNWNRPEPRVTDADPTAGRQFAGNQNDNWPAPKPAA